MEVIENRNHWTVVANIHQSKEVLFLDGLSLLKENT